MTGEVREVGSLVVDGRGFTGAWITGIAFGGFPALISAAARSPHRPPEPAVALACVGSGRRLPTVAHR
ncbi:conserved hypothetical protein [Streptomyces sviceus ATCC 29083]|uniref:Uncharacterized protein n=1 Tax=Streptomyces sviceus (strain ATCC 29083 / DSM 924 / JCM 4929 / NBRC 13980 / NCIMB 11184 / NRRL 5439 / UC 5370) TaxID=463191 RepID=B5HUH7_STRX2|nr:conserved hypothetical protein [Streptomyces sviceus ATCC 29083]